MKYFLIVLVILVSACKDDKTATSHKSEVGKTVSGQDILVPKKQVKFDCTNESCSESIVAIDQDGEVCTGVVKDSQVLVAKDCNKNLKCESVLITDINNKKYECESLSEEDGIYKLTLTEDISSLNASLGEVHKDDLLVKAIVVSKLDGSYKQISTNCSITFSSVNALASTKENSKNLAIKDCDNLSVGAVIFQNKNLLSINLNSDILNISRNMTCGEDCDNGAVDKLNFLIDEITAKTKVKNIRRLMEPQDKNGNVIQVVFDLSKNSIIGTSKIICTLKKETIMLPDFKYDIEFNDYNELKIAKMYIVGKKYIHTDFKIVKKFFGNQYITFTYKNKDVAMGVLADENLALIRFIEELDIGSINYKRVEIPICSISTTI